MWVGAMSTITRFAIKSKKGYVSETGYAEDIWDAKLFPTKLVPVFPKEKVMMFSITYQEMPYKIDE
jgi:hypothetical protein